MIGIVTAWAVVLAGLYFGVVWIVRARRLTQRDKHSGTVGDLDFTGKRGDGRWVRK